MEKDPSVSLTLYLSGGQKVVRLDPEVRASATLQMNYLNAVYTPVTFGINAFFSPILVPVCKIRGRIEISFLKTELNKLDSKFPFRVH